MNPRSPFRKVAFALAAASLMALVGASSASADAVKTSAYGNVFFHNDLMSVGLGYNGHFGTRGSNGDENAPVGYPTHMGASGTAAASLDGSETLGFVAVADPTKPGSWNDAVGDFFVPGGPYEGMILQANGQTGKNDNNYDDISGAWDSVSSGDTSFTWRSTSDWNGLGLTQVTKIIPNSTLLDNTVTITNNSSSAVNDVYYGRSVDPDNCETHDTNTFDTHNVIVSQVGVDGGKKSMVTASADCDGHTETIGLVSRDPGSAVCNHCWGINPGSFLQSPDAVGSVVDGDTGIAVAIPANPSGGNTLAPGQSVTLHFTYFLNAADADKAGIDSSILAPIPPESGGTPGASSGLVNFKLAGTPGHRYAVSPTPSFAKWKLIPAGGVGSIRVALPGFKKGKVGITKMYVRDADDPTKKTVIAELPWDFSIPWIVWGSVRTAYFADGKTPNPGNWVVNVAARDTAAPGDTRGLWAELSYSKTKPSDATKFPSSMVPNQVVRANGFNYTVAGPTPPKWVRVEDSWGNKSKWHGLGNMPTYPDTGKK